MPLSDKLFPGQNEDEKIIFVIRKHWFSYVIFIITALAMLIPPIALITYWLLNPGIFSTSTGDIIIILISSYLLFIMALILNGIVDYYLDIYIVTNERIVAINQEGLFRRQISELHIHQVQDVNARVQGIFQTLFQFGNIEIQTAAEKENFLFLSVPHPYRIAQQIIELHEKHIDEHVETEVKELEKPAQEAKGTPVGTVEQEITDLVKKPEVQRVITDQDKRVSKKEQGELKEKVMKDTQMQEKQHYLFPKKKEKKKKNEEGEMKANKEINLE